MALFEAPGDTQTVAYSRWTKSDETLVVLNRSQNSQQIHLPKRFPEVYRVGVATSPDSVTEFSDVGTQLRLILAPLSGVVLGR